MLANIDTGVAKNKTGKEIVIQGIRRLETQISYSNVENYGFEFLMDGKPIAALSMFNDGKVWMKNTLSDEIKTVIAAISTSLLVRDNLEDEEN